MLKVEKLHVSYGKNPVLRGLSAAFEPNRLTALVGPNGCGKSTLLKAVLGLLPIASGQALLDDQPLSGFGRRALARRIAYLPQESHCPDYLTLGELVEMAGHARYRMFSGPTEKDRALFREALGIVGLTGLEHRRINALSGGQRQRAWLAMVLAQDAEIVLMDEPVNHLDLTFQYAVLELVKRLTREQGKTVIAVLHDLNLAAGYADNLMIMNHGTVSAFGPMADVLTPANIERSFNLKAEVFRRGGRLVCLPAATQPMGA